MMAHVIADRLEMEAGAAGPVAQRRPIKPDPLARINPSLSIKRRMVAELRDDHVRNGRFGRQPAWHDMLRCVRLHDRGRAARWQAYFGPRVTSTRHCAGITLRRSLTSSPIFVMVPQPHGQSVLAGSMIRSTRGKCVGRQPRLR